MDDDGASHPQAGVRVWRGEDEPLRRALGDPAQGDLLTGLPASVPQLGARQQPPGPPAGRWRQEGTLVSNTQGAVWERAAIG